MRVLRIVEGTSVDGPGLRTSVYLAGCAHHCPGCHNPQSWDPAGGDDMSVEELMRVIAWNEAPLTLSGGDPLAQPEQVLELVRRVKTELNINIWLYTGYTWEQIVADRRLADVVRWVDVVVEGPFILARRDITLHFRGSSNQRIIDVPASLASSSAVELVQFS